MNKIEKYNIKNNENFFVQKIYLNKFTQNYKKKYHWQISKFTIKLEQKSKHSNKLGTQQSLSSNHIINSMTYVQFEYLYRKRKIFIEGQLDDGTFRYVTLLQKIGERFYFDQLIDFFIGLCNYKNDELGSVLFVLVSVLSSQLTSHFLFNTGIQGGLAHLTLAGLMVYAFFLHILFPKNYRLYLIGVLEVLLAIGVGVTEGYQVEDQNITLCFLVLNSACLVLGFIKKLLQEELENHIFSIFEFQSNLLIAIFITCKIQQFYYPYLIGEPINAYNLIPTITCISLINALKIWNLFEFNPVFLIKQLTTVHNNETQQMERRSLFEEIFHIGEELYEKEKSSGGIESMMGDNKTEAISNMMLMDLTNNASTIEKTTTTNARPRTDSISESLNDEINQSTSSCTQQTPLGTSPDPYSAMTWLAITTNFLFSALLILFILQETHTPSQLHLMSLTLFKLTAILLYCQHQSIMMGQNEKHKYYYLMYLLSDLVMVGHVVGILLVYQWFPFTEGYCAVSLALYAVAPLLTTAMYKEVAVEMNRTQDNRNVQHFFYCWVLVLATREALVIVGESLMSDIYLLIDVGLVIYFGVLELIVFRSEFYTWVWTEINKIRKMRKYKLYLLEGLRNWNYDITQLNQSLFLINVSILFLGYNQFKYQQTSSSLSSTLRETEYFIICCSAIVIHLLKSYNNYYTQTQIDHQAKPVYSPYYSYVVMVLGCGVYAAVSFLGDGQREDHRKWALLCAALCVFIIFTSVFGHYGYETTPHFRAASKPVNLVVTYFVFYYPFVTIFSVFFFTSNLQTSYIFRYAIAGFAYLTIASIVLSIFVHAILNLTEKSKRSLFLIKAISEEMKKINMKEDPQFISMIENLYDLMDGNMQKLLEQLKTQKISRIMLHDDSQIEYDYSIVEPDKKEKQHEYVKMFADNIENQPRANRSRNTLKIHSIKHLASNKKLQTKIHFYKKNSKDEETKLQKGISQELRKSIKENKNKIEVKRLIETIDSLRNNKSELIKVNKTIQSSQEFKHISMDEEKLRQIMHRFFHFISDPQDSLDFYMFGLVNILLDVKSDQDSKDMFNKYSKNGQVIDEQGIRDFIVDHMKAISPNTLQIESAQQMWKSFMQIHIFQFLIKGNDVFRYYMKRKNIEMSQRSVKIWSSLTNQEQQKEMADFKNKYNMKKYKALGKKARSSNIRQIQIKESRSSNQNQPDDEHISIDEVLSLQSYQENKRTPNQANKKNIFFRSPESIYTQIVQKLISSLKQYQKIEHEHFKLQSIKCGLSNIISILTKLFDFTYLYMYGSIYAMYAYGMEDYSNSKYILSFIDYNIVFGVALLGVVAYVGLLLFHKKDFSNGSLGVNENQRAISFTSIKYYTTFLLFLMGSSFSNVFIMTALNSYMCDQTTHTLWNFPNNECYSMLHIVEMFGSLLMLLTYYPLASLIFPFSSAIDRTLQIKYKAEYEIVYLQAKFLVNGINVIFNQLSFQKEELIKSVTKTIVCIILAVLFHKLKPCSVEFINNVELKIYIGLVIINAAGILCYFVGLKITVISFGILLFLYIIYSFISSIKISGNIEPKELKHDSNSLVNEKFRKQQIFKIRLRQCNNNGQSSNGDEEGEPETGSNFCKDKDKLEESEIQLSENNNRKFLNVENLLREKSLPKTKTEKISRKNKDIKVPSFTVKTEKQSEPLANKADTIRVNSKLPVELIPAAKRKSMQVLSGSVHSKMRRN